MTMLAGIVAVADDGAETYIPDTPQNAAKTLYLLLKTNAENDTVPVTTVTPAVVTVDPITLQINTIDAVVSTVMTPIAVSPDIKKGLAKQANLFGAWMVNYLIANAVTNVVVTIPATAAGDGLQTSQAVGTPTTRPASTKTINGVGGLT